MNFAEDRCDVCEREKWTAYAAQSEPWSRERIDASCTHQNMECYRLGFARVAGERDKLRGVLERIAYEPEDSVSTLRRWAYFAVRDAAPEAGTAQGQNAAPAKCAPKGAINDVRSKLEGMTRSRDKWKASYLELTAAIVRAGGLPRVSVASDAASDQPPTFAGAVAPGAPVTGRLPESSGGVWIGDLTGASAGTAPAVAFPVLLPEVACTCGAGEDAFGDLHHGLCPYSGPIGKFKWDVKP